MENQPFVECCSIVLSGRQFRDMYAKTFVELTARIDRNAELIEKRKNSINKVVIAQAKAWFGRYKEKLQNEFIQKRQIRNIFGIKIRLSEYRNFWKRNQYHHTFNSFLSNSYRVADYKLKVEKETAPVQPLLLTSWSKIAYEELKFLANSCGRYPTHCFNIPVSLIYFLDRMREEFENADSSNSQI
jgi:hypothetical protein